MSLIFLLLKVLLLMFIMLQEMHYFFLVNENKIGRIEYFVCLHDQCNNAAKRHIQLTRANIQNHQIFYKKKKLLFKNYSNTPHTYTQLSGNSSFHIWESCSEVSTAI